jgi:DNA polymerase III epsilon subunit family exonuclease
MGAQAERQDLFGRRTFVAFDTETTGMFAVSNRLVEIAAIKFCPGSDELTTFEALIDPERSMPAEVVGIHGITDDMVAGAEKAEKVLKRFSEFLDPEDVLIAHNAPFDIAFLGCEFRRAEMAFLDNLILDTVDIYRRLYPEQMSYSLLSLSQALGLADRQEHRAMADAVLVKRLLERAMDRMPLVESPNELRDLLSVYTMDSVRLDVGELPDEYADITLAISEGRQLEIVYASRGGQPRPRIIRPFQIHALRSIIYLNAFCETARAERTFRLDRIERFRLLPG